VSNDWRDAFRTGLEDLVDQAVVSGAVQSDVFKAREEIKRLGSAQS
jgi:hypothetical protein